MQSARPRFVLLDIGGTLLVEHDYDLVAGVTELLEASELAPWLESGDASGDAQAFAAAIDRVHRTNLAEFTIAGWLADRFPGHPGLANGALERRFWSRLTKLSPMPGVHGALAKLRADGVRLGAVSNAVFGSAAMAHELERHDLHACLEFVISSADHGVRKPSAELFHAALARCGAAPEDVWFVGDSWSNDVEGASAVGMRAIWFATDPEVAPGSDELPAVRVASWSEFETWYASEVR